MRFEKKVATIIYFLEKIAKLCTKTKLSKLEVLNEKYSLFLIAERALICKGLFKVICGQFDRVQDKGTQNTAIVSREIFFSVLQK